MNISVYTGCPATDLQTTVSSTLGRLLARGTVDTVMAQSFNQRLFNQFGISQERDRDLPVAALTALIDLDNVKSRSWLRADPVYLHADLSSLLLFDHRDFSLEAEEVTGYFSLLSPLLEEAGLHLHCGRAPHRWYLTLQDQPDITTTPPGVVSGQDIRPYLPVGKDSNFWLRLGNEIQMVLHDCEINQQRLNQGQTPVNSLWFWGCGALPEAGSTAIGQVICNDVLTKGLARHSGIPVESVTELLTGQFEQWLDRVATESPHDILIMLSPDELAGINSGSEQGNDLITVLDQKVYKPLASTLRKGRFETLSLVFDDLSCVIQRRHLWRFWRRAG